MNLQTEERGPNNIKIKWTAVANKNYTITYQEKGDASTKQVIDNHPTAMFEATGLKPEVEYMFTITVPTTGFTDSIYQYTNNMLQASTCKYAKT